MRILVVEDDKLIQDSMRMIFDEHSVVTVESAEEALTLLESVPYNILFLDIRLKGAMLGTELLKKVREIDPLLPVIMMSGLEDRKTIVDCLESGAVDYIVKGSVNTSAYAFVIHKASVWRKQQAEKLSHKVVTVKELEDSFNAIVGRSSTTKELKEKIAIVGKSNGPFLIQGETGTGKELVARAIWAAKGCANRPFITVNCAEFQGSMIEGELFGYEKGAFTGAATQRIGLFEAAHGGDIFLDEIGELPFEFQAKLLRVLQEKKVRRIGSNHEKAFDFRVIAATNRNLQSEVAVGKFREDLLFRLDVHGLRLAALQDRPEDISDLLEYYFAVQRRSNVGIPETVRAELASYGWPGNVRQLVGFVSFVMPFLDPVNPQITPNLLNSWLEKSAPSLSKADTASAKEQLLISLKSGGFNIDSHAETIKRDFIRAALDLGKFNRNEAARMLGVSRQRLAHWIEILGV